MTVPRELKEDLKEFLREKFNTNPNLSPKQLAELVNGQSRFQGIDFKAFNAQYYLQKMRGGSDTPPSGSPTMKRGALASKVQIPVETYEIVTFDSVVKKFQEAIDCLKLLQKEQRKKVEAVFL